MKLNDGIFHPSLNPDGWRCRYVNSTNVKWNEEAVGYELTVPSDCFNPALIYDGADLEIRNVSGRYDGLIIEDGSNTTTYVIHEW